MTVNDNIRPSKPVIYQMLPRLFTNYNQANIPGGTIEQNGSGKLNLITSEILGNIKQMGVTHVWYTGVIEHAHTSDYTRYGIPMHNQHIVKGKAGSPYAITDYYDIDPDLAVDVEHRREEFERLVERTHAAGLKVIIDFVPNHVGRQYHSDCAPKGVEDLGYGDNKEMFFAPYNNFYYITRQQFAPDGVNLGQGDDAYVEFPAKASGDDCFTAFPGVNNWYDTVKLNYGYDPGNGSRNYDPVPSTWYKMLHILRYWAQKGVDGFRCDMAHMVPVDFWRWAIPQVKDIDNDIVFIAEIYDISLYRKFIYSAGFDYLYDKVNLYDNLRAIETSNHSAATLTNCWQAVDGIGDHMLNFLENHDEQRFASEQYAGDAMRVTPSLVVSCLMSNGPFMIYSGQELGEKAADAEGYSGYDGRTTIFDYWSMPTVRRWLNHGRCDGTLTDCEASLRSLYSRVLNLAVSEPAFTGRFFDLMYVNYDNARFNPHRHFAFVRESGDDIVVVIVNFSDEEANVSVNVPQHAIDYLNTNPGYAVFTDLLTGQRSLKAFSADVPFTTHIPAHGAVLWKAEKSSFAAGPDQSKCEIKQ
ncbi:MAG: alpha-amylase family glycosyl hydrolase [Odoribacter sp.]|nr:alpha-amylase family glycosyl hydrolase [Odoribacter sp.]